MNFLTSPWRNAEPRVTAKPWASVCVGMAARERGGGERGKEGTGAGSASASAAEVRRGRCVGRKPCHRA